MLCICLDAFKPSYLNYAPYLNSISKEFLHGNLRTVFAYAGISATMFTGFYPDKHNVFSNFSFSQNSSIALPSLMPHPLSSFFVNAGRLLSQDYFFFNLPAIPKQFAKFFDCSMKKAWFQKDCLPKKTLFDIFEENSLNFAAVDWPNVFLNRKHGFIFSKRDSSTFEKTDILSKSKKFDFIYSHFLELDYISHEFGTSSNKVKEKVKELDSLIEHLDCDKIVFFSDHGMVDVKGTVDVWKAIIDLPFKQGKDFVFFLDSTVARFWVLDKRRKDAIVEKITESLISLNGGKVLTPKDLSDLNVSKYLADIVFLADPGFLIFPNFFQKNKPVKAMHGYSPYCKEQDAFYLIKGVKGGKKDANMSDLFPTILDIMSLGKTPCDGKSLIS